MPPLQNHELLPQCQIFQEQITATPKETTKENGQDPQLAEHEPSFIREQTRSSIRFIFLI
jgi:hypothetical protein